MTNQELLDVVKERGLLLEKEVFELMDHLAELGVAKSILESIEKKSGQKIITKSLIGQHFSLVQEIVMTLSGDKKQDVEHVLIKLGLTMEVVKKEIPKEEDEELSAGSGSITYKKSNENSYKLFYADTRPDKKLEIKDFTGYFRSRYTQMQRILMGRQELQTNLTSINKISGERGQVSIIGMVKEKRITKNGNLILTLEDLTGEIGVLIKSDNDLYNTADEVQLDDCIGVKASGNQDFLFAYEIYFPDSFLPEKTKFDQDISIAFVSDIHCGSNNHLGKSFEKFLEWLNSDDEESNKIRYLFVVGDNVDGVGVFPGQEDVLTLKSMREQYELLESYLAKVPKHITCFVCPGQHDASRVAEPQPLISKKYAPGLYDLENVILVTNPCMVKLVEGTKEFKVQMYHGASIHMFINEIKELRMMKAHKCPAKAVCHMLKRRHLSPTHGSYTGVYIPYVDNDPLVISEVPDVFCTGEVHRLDVENYHGTLIITGSCWQAQTPFEEKVGNVPDPCKVPVLNLKSKELKVFDFTLDETKKDEEITDEH